MCASSRPESSWREASPTDDPTTASPQLPRHTHLGAEILPSPARMDAVLAAARERIAAGNAPDAPGEVQSDRFDFGLVVGYVGFQSNRPEVIREGLGAMRAVRPDDTLVQLLQRVWLPDAAEPTRPTSPSER